MNKSISFILALLLIYSMQSSNAAYGGEMEKKDLKHHGVEWIFFGEGIIRSTKVIELSLYLDEHVYTATINDPGRVKELKEWIHTHFQAKLNVAPTAPRYESVEFLNSLTLYSSLETTVDTLMLRIPLTPFTLSCSQKEFDEYLSKLKEICGEMKRLKSIR